MLVSVASQGRNEAIPISPKEKTKIPEYRAKLRSRCVFLLQSGNSGAVISIKFKKIQRILTIYPVLGRDILEYIPGFQNASVANKDFVPGFAQLIQFLSDIYDDELFSSLIMVPDLLFVLLMHAVAAEPTSHYAASALSSLLSSRFSESVQRIIASGVAMAADDDQRSSSTAMVLATVVDEYITGHIASYCYEKQPLRRWISLLRLWMQLPQSLIPLTRSLVLPRLMDFLMEADAQYSTIEKSPMYITSFLIYCASQIQMAKPPLPLTVYARETPIRCLSVLSSVFKREIALSDFCTVRDRSVSLLTPHFIRSLSLAVHSSCHLLFRQFQLSSETFTAGDLRVLFASLLPLSLNRHLSPCTISISQAALLICLTRLPDLSDQLVRDGALLTLVHQATLPKYPLPTRLGAIALLSRIVDSGKSTTSVSLIAQRLLIAGLSKLKAPSTNVLSADEAKAVYQAGNALRDFMLQTNEPESPSAASLQTVQLAVVLLLQHITAPHEMEPLLTSLSLVNTCTVYTSLLILFSSGCPLRLITLRHHKVPRIDDLGKIIGSIADHLSDPDNNPCPSFLVQATAQTHWISTWLSQQTNFQTYTPDMPPEGTPMERDLILTTNHIQYLDRALAATSPQISMAVIRCLLYMLSQVRPVPRFNYSMGRRSHNPPIVSAVVSSMGLPIEPTIRVGRGGRLMGGAQSAETTVAGAKQPHIPQIFPNGIRPVESLPPCESHSFLITTSRCRLWGVCRYFYFPVSPRERIELSNSNYNLFNNVREASFLAAPTALVFITPRPLVEPLHRVLAALDPLAHDRDSLVREFEQVSTRLLCVSLRHSQTNFRVFNTYVSIPSFYAEPAFAPCGLERLSPECVAEIVAGIVSGRKATILVSKSSNMRTTAVAQLMSLLYPLRWPLAHPLIPVCPLEALDVLSSPLPHIVGLSPEQLEAAGWLHDESSLLGHSSLDTIFVDLDRAMIDRGSQTPALERVPHSLAGELVYSLTPYCNEKYNMGSIAKLRMLHTIFRELYLFPWYIIDTSVNIASMAAALSDDPPAILVSDRKAENRTMKHHTLLFSPVCQDFFLSSLPRWGRKIPIPEFSWEYYFVQQYLALNFVRGRTATLCFVIIAAIVDALNMKSMYITPKVVEMILGVIPPRPLINLLVHL